MIIDTNYLSRVIRGIQEEEAEEELGDVTPTVPSLPTKEGEDDENEIQQKRQLLSELKLGGGYAIKGSARA